MKNRRKLIGCAVAAVLLTLVITADLAYEDITTAFISQDRFAEGGFVWFGVLALLLVGLRRPTRDMWPFCVLAVFMGFSMVAGRFLDETIDLHVLLSPGHAILTLAAFCAWIVIGYCAFFLLTILLDDGTRAVERDILPRTHEASRWRKILSRFLDLFRAHPFGVALGVLVITWLPTAIGHLPALFMGDTKTQIFMWFGWPNMRSDVVTLIDPNVTLTTHHPVLHTAFLGLCVQAGQAIAGNNNAGAFLYMAIQFSISALCFAYAVSMLAKLRLPITWQMGILALFALVPWYARYAILVSKDAFFADALLVFCLQLALHARGIHTRYGLPALIVSAFFVAFMRNGGVIVAGAGLIGLVLVMRRTDAHVAKCSGAAAGFLIAVCVACSTVMYPALHITGGNRAEMLSIPFQQVSRYALEHCNELSDDERAAIDAIMDLDGLASRYELRSADPVKDHAAAACKDATDKEWNAFARTYFSLGLKHPETYMLAVAYQDYGYFYESEHKNQIYDFKNSAARMAQIRKSSNLDFHHHFDPFSQAARTLDNAYAHLFADIPPFSLFTSSALWCWTLLLFTAFTIRKREHAAVPILAACWMIAGLALLGPCNGSYYARYVYPLAAALPIAFPLVMFPLEMEVTNNDNA